jgi:hypothetical protein
LPRDIVDLRTYLNRNFAFGSFFTFVVGIGMYGTTYLHGRGRQDPVSRLQECRV